MPSPKGCLLRRCRHSESGRLYLLTTVTQLRRPLFLDFQHARTAVRHLRLAYHDRALRREYDVVRVARYIIANPLRAGLVDKVGDYPHWDAVWV